MNELHLLDILAARYGCFISDLNLSPILRRAALMGVSAMGAAALGAAAYVGKRRTDKNTAE